MIDMWRFAEGVRNDSLKHGQGLESDTVFYIEEISDNIDSTMIKPN